MGKGSLFILLERNWICALLYSWRDNDSEMHELGLLYVTRFLAFNRIDST